MPSRTHRAARKQRPLSGVAVTTAVAVAAALNLTVLSAASAQPTLTWQRQTVSAVAPGWFSSLVMDRAGRPHVAYRETNTLIKYAWYDGTTWRGQQSTTAPDVVFTGTGLNTGYLLSLALDGAGLPHIAFATQEEAAHKLRYARWSGSAWVVEDVQVGAGYVSPSPGYQHWIGLFPSLAIDLAGTPHISYIDCEKADNWDTRSCRYGSPAVAGNGTLMYATKDGGTWTTTAVDGPPSVSVDGDFFSGGTSLAIGRDGEPHIAYYNRLDGSLKYAKYDGGWTIQTVTTNGAGSLSLALSGDEPRIAYANGSWLHYAVMTSGSWAAPVNISGGSTWSYPSQPSLAFDGAGLPHIAHRAYTAIVSDGNVYVRARILHMWADDGTTWQSESVSHTSGPALLDNLWFPSLALDSDGRPRVTYWVQTGGTDTSGPILYAHLNAPPIASDDSTTVNEDSSVSFDVLANDMPGYGFSGPLSLSRIVTPPVHGAASINSETGRVGYSPSSDYFGPDSLEYEVCDANGMEPLCSTATLSIAVLAVNDAPTAVASPGSITAQYGDPVAPTTVTGVDVDNAGEDLRFSAASLPAGVTLTDNLDGTATVSGTPTVVGTYTVTVTVTDPSSATGLLVVPITVTAESVQVRLTQSNPHAVITTKTGAPAMTFTARITESADGSYDTLGRLSQAKITFSLDPIGGGSGRTCAGTVTRVVVATATTPASIDVTCTFGAGLGVDVYELSLKVSGNYYQGLGVSGLTVYDPAGSGVSGGGTLENGGEMFFTAKYLKNGRQVQGKMLYVLTDAEGNQSELKGNVLSALAITGATAKIAGKATLDGVGNYGYVLTAVDNGASGDLFGLQVKTAAGAEVASMTFEPIEVTLGNVFVRR